MRQWQKHALSVIREARAHATRTFDKPLHLACSNSIEAMVMEGGQVPSELRIYARQVREVYGASQPLTPQRPQPGFQGDLDGSSGSLHRGLSIGHSGPSDCD
jgi:hypothetical protein